MNYLLEGQQSERLLFRRLLENDFSAWLEFFQNPDSCKYLWFNDTEPEVNCKTWFEKCFSRYENNKGGMNVLVDRASGDFIGQCGLLIQTVDELEELEIGYSIMPRFWNKGYASEAAKKCRDVAFENNLRDSLISIIHKDNISSQKVALNNGMKLEKQTIYNTMPVNIYRIKNNDHS